MLLADNWQTNRYNFVHSQGFEIRVTRFIVSLRANENYRAAQTTNCQ
jgi:hypothetical protein